jgi:hypothetical protein
LKPTEHVPSVLWSKKQQRWVGACRCGFYVIGNHNAQADESQIRQNLQLHLSKHKTQTKEIESAG